MLHSSILVIGGTGFVVRRLVAALSARGATDVRLLTRQPDAWRMSAGAGRPRCR